MAFHPFPTLKRVGKRVIQTGFSSLWSTGFATYGVVCRPHARHWTSDGQERVVVIAPHPDDETIGCGGTILRHRAAGDRVTAVVITDGRRSRAYGLAPDVMANRRAKEVAEAAECLGIDLEQLGHPEGAWQRPVVARHLVERLAALRPTLIYAPSCLDFHPEHRAVAAALADALGAEPPRALPGEPEADFAGETGRNPVTASTRASGSPGVTVRVYPIQVPLRPGMIDRIVPVGEQLPQIEAALDCFHTQRGALEPTLRLRRYLGHLYRIPRGAESFWELSQATYHRLHRHPGDGGGARGLEHLAIKDPLAFLAAGTLRKQLAQNARAPHSRDNETRDRHSPDHPTRSTTEASP